jgi:23S rRNA (cytidine2498-2'-O)-methyltransferase
MNLSTVKPGYESTAMLEWLDAGCSNCTSGRGFICAEGISPDACFSSWYIENYQTLILNPGENRIKRTADWFCDAIRSTKIINPWIVSWLRFSENGFVPEISNATKLLELLKKRISRVVKLANVSYPPVNCGSEGLFIVENNADELFISRNAVFYGPRRMKDDSAAPSRSYLKVEEAFSIMGSEPRDGEIVVDLGAAPGGWSYAAAKRGADVLAIDNGPMKNGAAGNKRITHIRADAFRWLPLQPVNWLFCDMVEDPSRIVDLVNGWIKRKLCSNVIVNLKCGHAEPYDILKTVKSPNGFAPLVKECVCRHLYHDRDEFTVMLRV